ncbi:MAG: SRPBCC domain-containing protein [Actinomycetota bacterium]|nr:SRPBCC domain-containing protein [Actinomycetota bacterium]
MRIDGERHFEAPPRDVFRALTDPALLEDAFSAIEQVDASGDEWEVRVRPPLPGAFSLKFSVRLEEQREPEHGRLRAWGKSLGGRLSIDSSFDLEAAPNGTRMSWKADVDAAGILSGLGNQRLGPLAKQQAERALDRVAARVAPRPRRR